MPGPTIRQRLAGWLLKSAPRPWAAWYAPGSPHSTTWNFDNYATDGYCSNPYVYRCVKLLSTCASSVAALVYRGDVEVEDEKHAVNQLMTSPNPQTGWPEWLEEYLSYYLIGGQSFALGVGPTPPGKHAEYRARKQSTAPPRELWTLEPDTVSPVPGKLVGELMRFEYQSGNGKILLTTDDVFWFRGFDPTDPLQGMPPAAAARYAIDANTMALKYNYMMLSNGGAPGTILNSDTPLNDEEAATLKRHFDLHFGGADRAGGTHVTSGGVTVTQFGMTPKEMSWADLVEQTASQIAVAYGVPPQLVGARGSLTYSNLREARLALWTDGVFPLLDRFYAAFSRWINLHFTGGPYRITYDRDTVDALKEERAAVWARVQGSQFLTLNEQRFALDYEPIAGGDVILLPAGLLPLEAVTGAASVTEDV